VYVLSLDATNLLAIARDISSITIEWSPRNPWTTLAANLRSGLRAWSSRSNHAWVSRLGG
jgi:hypothetical protein